MYVKFMRTTIEIKDETRAELLRIAAQRGLKGYSELIQELLEQKIAEIRSEERRQRIDKAIAARGSITDPEAEVLTKSARSVREEWRSPK